MASAHHRQERIKYKQNQNRHGDFDQYSIRHWQVGYNSDWRESGRSGSCQAHYSAHGLENGESFKFFFFSFYSLGFLILCQLTLILQRRTLFEACIPSSSYAYWACRWCKIVCYLWVRHSKVLRKWNITCCLNNEFQSDPRIFLNSEGFERKNWRSSFCFWNLFKLEKGTDKSRWKFGFFRKTRNHVI